MARCLQCNEFGEHHYLCPNKEDIVKEYWVNVYQTVGIGTWYSKNKYNHRPDYHDYFMRPAYIIHVKMKLAKPKYEIEHQKYMKRTKTDFADKSNWMG